MGFERLEELDENSFFGDFAADDVWVLVCPVRTADVLNF